MSYQGKDAYGPSTLTPAQEEIAALSDQITRLDEQAQNFEDREQLGKASACRAKIVPLQARLNDLIAAARAAQ